MALEWVAIAVAAVIGVSLAVGLLLGRILGTINDAASRLQDDVSRVPAPVTPRPGPRSDDQRRRTGRQTIELRARN